MDSIDRAIEQVKPLVEAAPGAHTVMRGLEKRDGKITGKECVVVLVENKGEATALKFVLPYTVPVDGEPVRVDVQQSAPFSILLLRQGQPHCFVTQSFCAESIHQHQACFSPVVPGGVQISPRGANWVGTLGCPWKWNDGKDRYGFLTNRHVAGIASQAGHAMGQPDPQAKPVGALVKAELFRRDRANQVDLALYDSEVGGKHHVKPEVFGLPKLLPGIAALKLGDRVTKSGRTTGVTTGTVTGLDAQTTVGYGEHGNLGFNGQVVIEGDGGDFSAPGDSGSGIYLVESGGVQFGALLFAGGDGNTLANPAHLVQRAISGEPFTN